MRQDPASDDTSSGRWNYPADDATDEEWSDAAEQRCLDLRNAFRMDAAAASGLAQSQFGELAWGWGEHCCKASEACDLLEANGLAKMISPVRRTIFEHAVTLAYYRRMPEEEAVEAVLQHTLRSLTRAKNDYRDGKEALGLEGWEAINGVELEPGEAGEGIRSMCEEVGILPMYFLYRMESMTTHPGLPTLLEEADMGFPLISALGPAVFLGAFMCEFAAALPTATPTLSATVRPAESFDAFINLAEGESGS